MPTTSRGYPYPGLTDAPNGPSQVQALAVALNDDAATIVETFRNGDSSAIIGSTPAQTTPKIRQEFSLTSTTNVNGEVQIFFPTAFANGITYLAISPGDSTGLGGVGFIILNLGACDLTKVYATILTTSGARWASKAARVNIVAVGW